MEDIPGYSSFTKIEPLAKGLSGDQKYRVETESGRRLLLRLSAAGERKLRQTEYDSLKALAALGVPVPEPLAFGSCKNGDAVYMLLGWVDGEEVEAVLPRLSDAEQYVLGEKAGLILRRLHDLTRLDGNRSFPPADEAVIQKAAAADPATLNRPDTARADDSWALRYFSLIDERLAAYRAEGLPFEGSSTILDYIESHRHLLAGRPLCRLHGDYHAENLILAPDGSLSVIDWQIFDFNNLGDPWYELNRLDGKYPAYSSGQIDGYFDGNVPAEFWHLLAYYQAASAITSVVWAQYREPAELPHVLELNQNILTYYDQLKNPVPAWYLKDFYVQTVDGRPFKLKAPFDFSFLARYGKVFRIFDDQDSGNICFGCERDGQRYFVKFAGAPTVRSAVSPSQAVSSLQRTSQVYRDLAHPNLIRLLSDETIGQGYALIFDWAEGICMGRMYPESYQRFRKLPLGHRLQVFHDVLAFHEHVHHCGYVAVDFYDGSILYDSATRKTVICDIDLYQKKPYVNDMGRLWGSGRWMSPEEFALGAPIDEITNVYTMGAAGFAILSDYDRSAEKWPLGEKCFDVVRRATSDERHDRQQTIRQLIDEWDAAKEAAGEE